MPQLVSWADESAIPYMPPEPGGDWDRLQQYTSRFYADVTARSHYLAHARFLLTRVNAYTGVRYADEPAIMAWQLANEPRPMRQVSAYRGWLDAATELLKQLAPRQLVSIGTEGRTPFARSYVGIDFRAEHAHPRVDYATVHVWPQNWDWYSPAAPEATYARALNRSLEYLREHVTVAAALNKPLVLEEFGLARDAADHDANATTAWRDRYYADMFGETLRHVAASAPLVGANLWAWGGEGRPRRPRAPTEALDGAHCWRVGDALLGDPPHEAAGWYSVYDVDVTTHAVMTNLSAALATLPSDR
jgi:mannan endo-1,4-beta-mannosidase